MADSYMGGELGEAAALLNASTQHSMGETSFAEHVKDIYVGTGDSFLGMLRRGKIHQEQVPHMVRVLEEDLELYGSTGMALPKDIAPIETKNRFIINFQSIKETILKSLKSINIIEMIDVNK